MKRTGRILFWILLIAAVFIAIAYFLPRTVYVEKKVRIEASPKIVYAQVIDLHTWDHWSKWNQMDPDIKIEYINHGVGVGAGYKWQSEHKNVGNGSITIVEAEAFDYINTELQFEGQGAAKSSFIFHEKEGQTDLTWTLTFDLGNNPLMRWMGFMIRKSVGKDYETGLTQLNALCSVIDQEKEFVVWIDKVEEFTFASIRKTVPFIEISLEMGNMYGEISAFLAQNGTEMAGMPYSRYHLMNDEEIDLECGIPTTELLQSDKHILTGTFPASKCITLDFYGDYNNLMTGHEKIQKWMKEHEFNVSDAPMEFYLTDPGLVENPDNWLTRICYPIE